MGATEPLRTTVAVVVIAVVLAGSAVVTVPKTQVTLGADPESSFYYESDIGDGIGIGRTGYGQTGDADFEIGGLWVNIPQSPYQERFSFKLDRASGERLVAGQTYTGGVTRLESGGVRHRLCTDPSASAHHIHDVGYDSDGAITLLSMSSAVECGSDGIFHSELRYNTTSPRYAGVLTQPNHYDRLELPSVAIGGHSDQDYSVTAVGSQPAVFGSPTVQGQNPAPFSIIDDTCASGTFDAGQTCSLTVRFSPTARGRREVDVRLALNSPSGHRDLRVSSVGQVPTTTTLEMKKGPYTGRVGITTQLQPVPDDINGHCMTLRFMAPAQDHVSYGQCDAEGKSQFVPDMDHTRYQVQAISIATREFASSASEPRWARWVQAMDSWATSRVSPATFFPYRDGYRDDLLISGKRKFDIAVRIVITRLSDGDVMGEVSLPKAIGDYDFGWDGQNDDGSGLAPYGTYDVAVTLTEDEWNEQTFHHEVRLSRQWVEWTKRTKTLNGTAFGLSGVSANATVSKARSAFASGVRLDSGKGVAVVEYAFPVATSSIYGWMSFRVKGRSPNGHQAAMAMWNPKRGGYRDLANFDAVKAVGPKYQWWTTASDGSFRVRNGKARTAVLVWQGLGKKGPAAFDIKQVQLVYRTGKLMSPSTLSAEVPSSPSVAGGGERSGTGTWLSRRLSGQPWPWLRFAPHDQLAPEVETPSEPEADEGQPDAKGVVAEPDVESTTESAPPSELPEPTEPPEDGERAAASPEPVSEVAEEQVPDAE